MVKEVEIEQIFKEAGTQPSEDRNETYESSDIEVITPTKEELEQAEKDAQNPEYDVYDTEEDWNG